MATVILRDWAASAFDVEMLGMIHYVICCRKYVEGVTIKR